MTVAELIHELQTFPPEAVVCTWCPRDDCLTLARSVTCEPLYKGLIPNSKPGDKSVVIL